MYARYVASSNEPRRVSGYHEKVQIVNLHRRQAHVPCPYSLCRLKAFWMMNRLDGEDAVAVCDCRSRATGVRLDNGASIVNQARADNQLS